MSEDSVRRAFLKGPEAEWDAWLRRHERAMWEPLLTEPYALVTNTDLTLSAVAQAYRDRADRGNVFDCYPARSGSLPLRRWP